MLQRLSDSPRSVSAIDRHVGRRVRAARIAAGISQEQLAAELGVTFQQVQKYEKGINRIAASRLEAIGRALGRPHAFFFDGAGSGIKVAKAPLPTERLSVSREGQRLAAAFVRISDKRMRDAILQIAERAASGDAMIVPEIGART